MLATPQRNGGQAVLFAVSELVAEYTIDEQRGVGQMKKLIPVARMLGSFILLANVVTLFEVVRLLLSIFKVAQLFTLWVTEISRKAVCRMCPVNKRSDISSRKVFQEKPATVPPFASLLHS